jgi:TolB-like protein
MIGWWHAYEVTFGGHKPDAPASAKSARANVPPLSLVVLPLSTDGGLEDDDWFADALLGDLTGEVARLPDTFVIARDTAYTFKGKTVDPREAARELAVRYVVTGRLRREGDSIRLDVSLIDGDTGAQRWSEKFVVDRSRLRGALDEFALRLSRHLSIELTRSAGSRADALSPDEVTADDLSMRALALWYRGVNRENLTEALALLERAVSKDPNSVRAWGGLAFMNLQGATNGWLTDRAAAFGRIDQARSRLERLDPEGHYTYQARVIDAYLKKDFQAMLRLSREWSDRHRIPVAFGALGIALVLNGRLDEGVAPLELALRLSPRDSFRAEWQYRLSLTHFFAGRYEQARHWGEVAQVSNPALNWPPIHAAAMLQLGDAAAAKKIFEEFQTRHPKYDAAQIERRMPGTEPRYVEGRERLTASLREIGLR